MILATTSELASVSVATIGVTVDQIYPSHRTPRWKRSSGYIMSLIDKDYILSLATMDPELGAVSSL